MFAIIMSLCLSASDDPKKNQPDLDKIVASLKAKDAKVRLRAIGELKALGEKANSATSALCLSLLDPSQMVQQATLEAIEKVAPPLYKPLVSIVIDKSSKGWNELSAMKQDAEPVVGYAVAYLKQDAATESASIAAIVFIGETETKDEAAIKALMEWAVHPNVQPKFKCTFMTTLAKLGKNDDVKRRIYPVFKTNIEPRDPRQRDLVVVQDAIRFITTYRGDAKDALPTLKKLKLSTNEIVRDLAGKAVDSIEGK